MLVAAAVTHFLSKMDTDGKLSIVVQSAKHFDLVRKLATAAVEKGKRIKIHMVGNGVLLVKSGRFTGLDLLARVTICEASGRKLLKEGLTAVPESVEIVQPGQINDIIQWSDRSIVF